MNGVLPILGFGLVLGGSLWWFPRNQVPNRVPDFGNLLGNGRVNFPCGSHHASSTIFKHLTVVGSSQFAEDSSLLSRWPQDCFCSQIGRV